MVDRMSIHKATMQQPINKILTVSLFNKLWCYRRCHPESYQLHKIRFNYSYATQYLIRKSKKCFGNSYPADSHNKIECQWHAKNRENY